MMTYISMIFRAFNIAMDTPRLMVIVVHRHRAGLRGHEARYLRVAGDEMLKYASR